MNQIFFIVLCCCLLSCSLRKQTVQEKRMKVEILAIDSTKFTGFYIIKIDKGLSKDTCQIFSQKEIEGIKNYGKKIKVGEVYEMNLKLLKTTKKITSVNQRLYERDISVDGIFIFPFDMLSYESNSLKGIHYLY
ncbi:MAG: hypothetical protein AAF985_01005 [Bacteroidota bacterium]